MNKQLINEVSNDLCLALTSGDSVVLQATKEKWLTAGMEANCYIEMQSIIQMWSHTMEYQIIQPWLEKARESLDIASPKIRKSQVLNDIDYALMQEDIRTLFSRERLVKILFSEAYLKGGEFE